MTLTATLINYSVINACESDTAGWNTTPAAVTDFYKQGSYCFGWTVKLSGTTDRIYTWSGSLSGKHLHLWYMTTSLKELSSVNVILTGGGNTGYYDVLTSTTYPGGWYNIVLDCDRTPDSGTQPTLGSITAVGIRITLSQSAKNAQNTWIDHIYTGEGIQCTSDAVFALSDIFNADKDTANGWGIIRQISGVYYLVGSLLFGDTGSLSCDFKDTSQVIVFENRKVSASLYTITCQNNSGTCKFQFGDKSGTSGISGCYVRVEELGQNAALDIICTDTNVSDFKLYGSTFFGTDSIQLPTSSANREVLNCNFESCGEVLVDTCTIKYSNFVNATDRGVRISSLSHNVSDCNFIGCEHGAHINVVGEVPFSNMVFVTGTNTYDVENSTASAVIVSCTGTTVCATYENTGGGSTTISNDKILEINGVYTGTEPTNYVRCHIECLSGGPESEGTVLLHEEATVAVGDGTYKAVDTYNYTSDQPVVVRARYKGFTPFDLNTSVKSDGLKLTAVWISDPNYI